MSTGLAHRSATHTRLLDNPFLVLELAPDASRAEVERAGQKLLAMLELGLTGAARYPTPFGPQPRDPAKVREAMAQLRDPQRRLGYELWAVVELGPTPAGAGADVDLAELDILDGDAHATRVTGFMAALSALGWR